MENDDKPRLGVSSCLLGQEVRYDGSHKLNRYITDTLGEVFDLVPFCPEVAIGLGVPRSPIHMVRVGEAIRLRGVDDPSRDVTEALCAYGAEVAGLCSEFSGYLFKSRSPSCGMAGIEIFSEAGVSQDSGPGLFADAIMRQHPALPVEEEERLMDPQLRENFIERVFIYRRWQHYIKVGMEPERLVEFHSRHKFSVLAHDEAAYRQLGRLVAEAGKADMEALGNRYITLFMRAMKKPATPGGHSNVLQHMAGFIKGRLGPEEKRELLEAIEGYRLGRLPLRVPITLLKHFLRRYPNATLQTQYYLNLDPREWRLRHNA